MPENLNLANITEDEAQRAGAIVGALIGGVLWQLRQEPGPITFPLREPSQKKYLSAKEAADLLEVGKTKFYELAERADFPNKQQAPSGAMKYLAAEILKYKAKRKKA